VGLGTPGQAEPVHLADHRVARDAAKLGGDLAGTQAILPELLQEFHPFIAPRHAAAPCTGNPSRSGTEPQSAVPFAALRAAPRDVVYCCSFATISRESDAIGSRRADRLSPVIRWGKRRKSGKVPVRNTIDAID